WGPFGRKEIKKVLNNLNLEINNGEIFGITGQSGSGKSTLAKCILGLVDFEGEISINGKKRPGNNSSAVRKRNAFEAQAVFQNPGASLNPVKTIGWIMEEPLRANGIGTPAERSIKVDEMLDLVGLDSVYKKRKPHELSSGQKQRVSIGAALILKPGLIVADEPVSALDVSVGAQIINLFRDLNKRLGLTLLFISHNIELVTHLCGRTALIKDGKAIIYQ
ncbi:MAG: dipeptide/oligopeptide/nickel ABC transporter ATP-binding protein, partial [Treponema sp.]|nr:dipeptide/oligopeptide/nickel ABC transporter ATP-binding protein [Treponema sp.]